MRLSLTEIANKRWSESIGPIDKGTEAGPRHGYTHFYDQLFTPIRDKELLILEIGVSGGGSLNLWYNYFPNATIIGLDINDESYLNNDRCKVYQLDQSDDNQLENFVQQCIYSGYEFDIIIDDGSHHMRDQQKTLAYLFPLLKSKGIYIIEDLHTSLADEGYILYGKSLQTTSNNSTLRWLQSCFDYSSFMTAKENFDLGNNIETITIHNRINPFQEPQFKGRSITSAIIKK